MAKTILIGANHAGTACANTILSYPNQELTIYDRNSFLGMWNGALDRGADPFR